MANIFKTTLKKDIITDIVDNNKREIRFPLTKFWASRFTDEYNLDEKTFQFKTFDSLEFSSPSNKETDGVTYTFDYVGTMVDGDEFVIEFKEIEEELVETQPVETDEKNISEEEISISEEILETVESIEDSDVFEEDDEDPNEDPFISNYDMFALIKQWLKNEMILEDFYEDETVFATNARQVIVLPKGKPLGFKKRLPVNNDVEVRIEFDKNEKIYFDLNPEFELFEEAITKKLAEIRKNNFVFVWKQYTGIFMDKSGRIYFGMKYSTRRSIGFNRKYNVQ
jgi:hypothetical protein